MQKKRVIERPFGDLLHFEVSGRETQKRKILVVAPMSGHYATLLRSTVKSLIVDNEVYVTDWHNARDIPVSEGKFDVEDYTLYLVEFMRELGPDTHVIAICQPAPLTLAATAYLAEEDPKAQPLSLTLIGGPIDPDAAATDVTDFGRRVTMGQLEETMIQRVGFKYKGAGRLVYPGLLQLSSFMSMNAEKHSKAFTDQISRVAKDEAFDDERCGQERCDCAADNHACSPCNGWRRSAGVAGRGGFDGVGSEQSLGVSKKAHACCNVA